MKIILNKWHEKPWRCYNIMWNLQNSIIQIPRSITYGNTKQRRDQDHAIDVGRTPITGMTHGVGFVQHIYWI